MDTTVFDMEICGHGGLIFVANTTVLLFLALMTDYWEYRTFNVDVVLRTLMKDKSIEVEVPFDTNSYVRIKIESNTSFRGVQSKKSNTTTIRNRMYQAPAFLVKSTEQKDNNSGTNMSNIRVILEISIFKQYGNLFRDCDDVECK